MRALGIAGLSVTMPHKSDVYANVDLVAPEAEALESVNTVSVDTEGLLVGHSTDGGGFVDSLRADAGVDPAGCRIAVIGAGGAARSVIDALGRAGAAEVVVVNRTPAAAEYAATLAHGVGRVGTPDDVRGADVVVNATSVGMGSDVLALDPALLRHGALVADLVYHPLDTALLRAARGTRLPHARRARHVDPPGGPSAGVVDRPRTRCGRHAGGRRGRARRRLSEASPPNVRG